MRFALPLALLALLGAGCASTPPEEDPVQIKLNDLDTRVGRMERIVANQVQVAQRLDEIQNNLRELRGRVDELEHSNDALSKQQRDLYNDLDKRLGPRPAARRRRPVRGAPSAAAAPGSRRRQRPGDGRRGRCRPVVDGAGGVWAGLRCTQGRQLLDRHRRLQGLPQHLSDEPARGERAVLAGRGLLRERTTTIRGRGASGRC